MKFKWIGIIVAVLGTGNLNAQISYDNADDPAYDDGWQQPGDNGGSGFQPWSNAGYADGFLASSGQQIDGTRSFALPAMSDGNGISRDLDTPLWQGELSLRMRFAMTNIAIAGFLGLVMNFQYPEPSLAFGMKDSPGNSEVVVQSGFFPHQIIDFGEDIRDDVIFFNVRWDALNNSYSVMASNMTTGIFGSVSGSGENITTPISALTFFARNPTAVGGVPDPDQNLIFDNLSVVPEPSTITLMAIGSGSLLCFLARRRHHRGG